MPKHLPVRIVGLTALWCGAYLLVRHNLAVFDADGGGSALGVGIALFSVVVTLSLALAKQPKDVEANFWFGVLLLCYGAIVFAFGPSLDLTSPLWLLPAAVFLAAMYGIFELCFRRGKTLLLRSNGPNAR